MSETHPIYNPSPAEDQQSQGVQLPTKRVRRMTSSEVRESPGCPAREIETAGPQGGWR